MTQRLTGEESGESSHLENKAYSVKKAEYYTTM